MTKKQRRNPNIQVTVSDDEYDQAAKIAIADGRTVPNWAKQVILKKLKDKK